MPKLPVPHLRLTNQSFLSLVYINRETFRSGADVLKYSRSFEVGVVPWSCSSVAGVYESRNTLGLILEVLQSLKNIGCGVCMLACASILYIEIIASELAWREQCRSQTVWKVASPEDIIFRIPSSHSSSKRNCKVNRSWKVNILRQYHVTATSIDPSNETTLTNF